MTAGAGPVRLGLVGYGLGGRVFHAPLIDAGASTRLDAVVTSSAARAAEVRRRYPGVRLLATAEELLADPGRLDAVVVSTPNATHVPLAEAALAAGLPVVVDKPVATSPAELEALGARAAAAGLGVVPFHNRRWDGDFLTLQALLGSDRLGPLHRVESRWDRWKPDADPGPDRAWKARPGAGILHDLGTHLVDQVVRLFGPPEALTAEVRTVREGGTVADDVWIGLRYPAGPAVQVWTSAAAGEPAPRWRVLGRRGAWCKEGLDPQEDALAAGARPGGPGWGEETEDRWGRIVAGDRSEPVVTLPGAYPVFYERLATWVRGAGPVPVDLADALVVARILAAAEESAASGRTVALMG